MRRGLTNDEVEANRSEIVSLLQSTGRKGMERVLEYLDGLGSTLPHRRQTVTITGMAGLHSTRWECAGKPFAGVLQVLTATASSSPHCSTTSAKHRDSTMGRAAGYSSVE